MLCLVAKLVHKILGVLSDLLRHLTLLPERSELVVAIELRRRNLNECFFVCFVFLQIFSKNQLIE